MSFRVVWDEVALRELDQIWLESVDPEGIEHLSIRINTELAHNAIEAGESREGNNRILFKYPLCIWFRVFERLQEVRVLHVRLSRRVL